MGFHQPRDRAGCGIRHRQPVCAEEGAGGVRQGLTIGGKKYTVEIFTADSQSSDSRAAQVAQQLITQNNVDIMLTTSARRR